MFLGPDFYKVVEILKTKKSFAIFGHMGPDLDCIGSQLSLANFLESIGKKVCVVNYNKPSEVFSFLPNLNKFSTEPPALSEIEAVIVVDTSPTLTGFYQTHSFLLKDFYPIIEIDHHQKKLSKKSIHIHKIETSSTSEIIYYILKELNFKIDKDIANLLIGGIYGDTNGFLNSNVFESTLNATADLMNCGGDGSVVIEKVLRHISLEELNLWASALTRLGVNQKSKIAHTFLTNSDIEANKKGAEALSGLSNFLNSVKEANISMVLSEKEKGTIKGSLRSRSDVDVNRLAKLFSPNGGGHVKAAGFSIAGTFKNLGSSWKIEKLPA